jgi:hypothetical protein
MPRYDKALPGEVRDELLVEPTEASDGGQRIVRCTITGRRHVAARPGERKVTSEEIYRLLQEDLP